MFCDSVSLANAVYSILFIILNDDQKTIEHLTQACYKYYGGLIQNVDDIT